MLIQIPLLRACSQVLLHIPGQDQVSIRLGIVVNQVVQLGAVGGAVAIQVFDFDAVDGEDAVVGVTQFHTGCVHVVLTGNEQFHRVGLSSVSKIGIRNDLHLERRGIPRAAAVVDREVQLFQQRPPAAGVVAAGDKSPAAIARCAPGVVILRADGTEPLVILYEAFGHGGADFLFARFGRGVVLIQPLLERDPEAPFHNGVRGQLSDFEVGVHRRAAVVQNELLHRIPDRRLGPSVERQLVDHGM